MAKPKLTYPTVKARAPQTPAVPPAQPNLRSTSEAARELLSSTFRVFTAVGSHTSGGRLSDGARSRLAGAVNALEDSLLSTDARTAHALAKAAVRELEAGLALARPPAAYQPIRIRRFGGSH